MTECLRALLGPVVQLSSEERLRNLFPECSGMTSDEFLKTIHGALCPSIPYATFLAMKTDSLHEIASTLVPSAYVQRGDYYLMSGQWRAALEDYGRAYRGFPDCKRYTERWRLARENTRTKLYVDSEEEPEEDPSHPALWVKLVATDSAPGVAWSLQRWKFDCAGKTTRTELESNYRADGSVIDSQSFERAVPERILPGTVAEWFFRAVCR